MSGPETSDDAPSAPLQTALKRLTSPTAGVLLVVLIVGLLVAAVSAASLQRRDPAYESSQALLIDQPKALVAAPSGDLIAKLATLRVKYVSLLRSDAVISPAAEELGLAPGAVAASVRAVAPSESLLLVVIGRSGDAEAAQEIATAVGGSLADYLAAEQAELGVPEADQVTLTPLREASAAAKVEPSARRSVSVGIVGGAVVALLLYLVLGLAPGITRRTTLFR
jgi:capsular polysaccharide biosynthesis protein